MFENVKFFNRLAFLFGAIAVFILAFSLIYYAVNQWFRINKIIVRGNISNITQADLAHMVSKRLHGTFFTLDINLIKHEFEQVPWVKSVHVYREFPDTIYVDIVEYKAIANLGNGRLLSEERLIFDGYDRNGELPLFRVPFAQIDAAFVQYEHAQNFARDHNLNVVSISYNGLGLTKFSFSNHLSITICANELDTSLGELNKYWQQLYQIESGISTINMCYNHALAIK